MGRPSKQLADYAPHEDLKRVHPDFDNTTSQEKVKYTCRCGQEVNSTKRLIAARLKKNSPLLCTPCKNKSNRIKGYQNE